MKVQFDLDSPLSESFMC